MIDKLLKQGIQRAQQGDLTGAEVTFRKVVDAQPSHLAARNFLGFVLYQQNKFAEAIEVFRTGLNYHPNDPMLSNGLGNILRERNQLDLAEPVIRAGLTRAPNDPALLLNMGTILEAQGHPRDAIYYLQRAITLDPKNSVAWNNFGAALWTTGQTQEALIAYKKALELNPKYLNAMLRLADSLQSLARHEQSLHWCKEAIALPGGDVRGHNLLGIAYYGLGKIDEAISSYQAALATGSTDATIRTNLAIALKDVGRLDESIARCREAILLDPQGQRAYSALFMTMRYHPQYDDRMIFRELSEWNAKFGAPLAATIKPHQNERSIQRKLRIGYLSSELFSHPATLFTVPLLTHHDRKQFKIYCYPASPRYDSNTERIKSLVDEWHPIFGLTDDEAAAQIRQDEIDILIDLSMHSSISRLLVFARKPAPVQATWLAYPGTTGLTNIDYRLSDPYLDPDTSTDANYSEKTVRLPETFWCYDPMTEEPAVNPLPALANHYFTFGCLNNSCKANEEVRAAYWRIMNAVPESRIIMYAQEGNQQQAILTELEAHGIDKARVKFTGRLSRKEYLELYHEIDICLDTWPFAGGTTTLDALWMGVPVVTWPAMTVAGRGGVSILSNLGLNHLIAKTKADFEETAKEVANDLVKLAELRKELRQRLKRSPLMDEKRFAAAMEAAYREMWRRWCAGGT